MDIAVVVISDGVEHQAPRPIKEAMDGVVGVISVLPDHLLVILLEGEVPMVV